MKAADLYKRLKGHFGPWAKMQGFSPLAQGLSWSRFHGSQAHILRFSADRKDCWDRYAGSQFVLDFEIGNLRNADLKNRCFRYCRLLTDAQREELLVIQNRVVGSLIYPTDDYERVQDMDPETRAWYFAKFVPLPVIDCRDDVWLRYYTVEHVDEWAQYLLRQMPQLLNELEERS